MWELYMSFVDWFYNAGPKGDAPGLPSAGAGVMIFVALLCAWTYYDEVNPSDYDFLSVVCLVISLIGGLLFPWLCWAIPFVFLYKIILPWIGAKGRENREKARQKAHADRKARDEADRILNGI